MQRFDEPALNTISYSLIQTVDVSDDYSDDSCTCGHDDHHAFGDGLQLRQVYADKKIESSNNYGTATEHEMLLSYPKYVADRFEAEYDFCMRWAADHKFVAARVIPFQSNFSSVVRLMFQGRNWVLDCANYDGQYDYCGWLPSVVRSLNDKNVVHNHAQSLQTDSSDFLTGERHGAGKSVHPSDTGYGLKSLQTDYSSDSGLTKDPIDAGLYKLMGTASESEKSLHSTLENLSPILGNQKMALESVSDISTGSSLKAVLHDLVELDQIFAQKVEEAQQCTAATISFEEYLNSLPTARSFSESAISTAFESGNEVSNALAPKSAPSIFSQLACLAGRKIGVPFWRNWSKSKK